jgi:hypothetical protein
MAISGHRTNPPSPNDSLQDRLATLLNIHRTREPKSDSAKVVIGLVEGTDQTEHYRYYHDTHCVHHLSRDTKEDIKTKYVDNGKLELVSEGAEFIALKHPDPSGENDVRVIETLLEDVHNTTLDETAYIREVVENTTQLPINALCGVTVETETSSGP